MLKQQLSTSQRQRLSPTQYQVIRMLGYSTVEFEQLINKELEANPALEESERSIEENAIQDDYSDQDPADYDQTPTTTDDIDIMEADYYRADESNYMVVNNFSGDKEIPPSQGFSSEESFQDNLFAQLDETTEDDLTKHLAKYIIGSLDANGYLTRSLENLSDDLAFSMGIEVSTKQLRNALDVVQSLEPAGIGAEDLQECLTIQIERKKLSPSVDIARQIIKHYFDYFTEKDYNKIAEILDISDAELQEAIDEILHLNPKPGNELRLSKTDELSSQIIPDFTVEQYNGSLYVSLNRFNYPRLSVSEAYKSILNDLSANGGKSPERRVALSFTQQKVEEATQFIEAIRQRNQTLIRTMIAIANHQRHFLISGDESTLLPMRLKDIAEVIGYDQSTISRATSNKYVQTQYGVFPLRYFFSEAIKTAQGGEVSSKKLMSVIEEMIEGEDKANPLTDMQITQQLNSEGYQIARRTVAKYREELQIPTSTERNNKKKS